MSQLKQAITLAQNGQADRAAAILRDLTKTNPQDLYAWLWLAETTPDVHEARRAAQQVLTIRPTHPRAQAILDQLSSDDPPIIPKLLRPKRKRAPYAPTPSYGKFVGVALVMGVLTLVAMLFFFTQNPTTASSASRNRAKSSGNMSKISVQSDTADNNLANMNPETLTAQWVRDVVTGKQEADFSFSCDEGQPSGLQRTLEPLAERFFEYGIRQILRTLQLEGSFDLLRVVDDTAEYSVNGRLVVEVFGQRYESPRFNTVVRFVSDQGQWAICEVTGLD